MKYFKEYKNRFGILRKLPMRLLSFKSKVQYSLEIKHRNHLRFKTKLPAYKKSYK